MQIFTIIEHEASSNYTHTNGTAPAKACLFLRGDANISQTFCLSIDKSRLVTNLQRERMHVVQLLNYLSSLLRTPDRAIMQRNSSLVDGNKKISAHRHENEQLEIDQ